MSEVPSSIRNAYDPERFRTDGHRLIDAMADQMARWQRREGAVLPWREPAAARRHWEESTSTFDIVDELARIAAASTGIVNPRCMGHQVAPPLPAAALAELVSAVLNNGMAVYEMGPASTPIELAVIEWLCQALGLPKGAGGVLTHGGSLGNLTALLAMRQAKAGFDVWRDGYSKPLALVVSSDSHYSIARALSIMGMGEVGAIKAPLDAHHRMTARAVEEALASAGERTVIGIVAAAGSTATGAFDPLDEIADVAARHQLWLHVDAAHGGGVCMSQAQRGKLRGIERADSVVWDAHKLLMMPALVTAVLFKRESSSYEAFAQQASYLFTGTRPEDSWWDLGQRTLECTKRAMSIELWTALRSRGGQWFGDVVDRQHELALALAAKVDAAPDFELALAPESNIVCYRHTGATDLDAHNRALKKRVVEDGKFYIVGTQLPSGYHLRSTLMNPLTETRDLDELLDHLRSLCPK
ncbi:MAG: aminotransferase class I/II-fold pyridoxal phosphate-dependent enzyme [Myxococcota bacterium]|nr:aminotransferase class I/II-fold pyridoxal phosphate-dependent enzyme [Myxococcota bacterium]